MSRGKQIKESEYDNIRMLVKNSDYSNLQLASILKRSKSTISKIRNSDSYEDYLKKTSKPENKDNYHVVIRAKENPSIFEDKPEVKYLRKQVKLLKKNNELLQKLLDALL